MYFCSQIMADEIEYPKLPTFIIIVALMMALVALAIDMMLPALPMIGDDLGVRMPNDNQLVVSILFLGLAFGQLLYGPLADSYGRKPSVYLGFTLFLIGCIVSLVSNSLFVMLLGRFIQGFGLAGPRIISVALVRDRFAGQEMARIMSIIMAIFIIVPIVAPALGQLVLNVADWKYIFVSFLIYGITLLVWFGLKMPETLVKSAANKFTFQKTFKVIKEILNTKTSIGYTIASGFVSSLFLGYLNSSQQLFQETYNLGEQYALIFALLAFAVGLGSFLNGQILVKKFGMQKMVKYASFMLFSLSLLFLIFMMSFTHIPSLTLLLAFFSLTLFHVGILFGNLNSLAMEPLGHIAGVGSTMVGAITTFISVPLGIIVGLSYDGTVFPLIIGFTLLSGLCFLVIYRTNKL